MEAQVLFIITLLLFFMCYLIVADDSTWFGKNKVKIFYILICALTILSWLIIGAFALTIAVFSFLVWMGNLT